MSNLKDSRRNDRNRYVGKQMTKAERKMSQEGISLQRAIANVFKNGKRIIGNGQ